MYIYIRFFVWSASIYAFLVNLVPSNPLRASITPWGQATMRQESGRPERPRPVEEPPIWGAWNAPVEVDTPPKTNGSPLKIGHPKRKLVFQPSIFRCYVSFREGTSQVVVWCIKPSTVWAGVFLKLRGMFFRICFQALCSIPPCLRAGDPRFLVGLL